MLMINDSPHLSPQLIPHPPDELLASLVQPHEAKQIPSLPNFALALVRVAAFRLSQNAHSQPTGWTLEVLRILMSNFSPPITAFQINMQMNELKRTNPDVHKLLLSEATNKSDIGASSLMVDAVQNGGITYVAIGMLDRIWRYAVERDAKLA
jgi:hypothetical protein